MSSAMVCRLLRVTLMPMSARSLLRAVASRKKYFPQSDGHCAVSSRLASTDLLYWAYRWPPVPMKHVVRPYSVITPASGPDTCWPMFTVSLTPGQIQKPLTWTLVAAPTVMLMFELTKATVIGTFETFAGFAGFAGRAAAGRAGVFAGMPHPDRAARDSPAAMATASSRLGAAIPYFRVAGNDPN